MSNVKRRYFVVERSDAPTVIANVEQARIANAKARQSLQDQHAAMGFMVDENWRPRQLILKAENKPPVGCKHMGRLTHQGTPCIAWAPKRNILAGKKLGAAFDAVPAFNYSDQILHHYDAREMLLETGNSMAVSSAGIVKGQIVIQRPEEVDKPWQAPSDFREIKKSEYIALTEE